MARAAAGGDGGGAATAAEKAASRLTPLPGSPPAPEADRRRVADGLSGAAGVAQREHLSKLADQLNAAADAIRRADAEGARRTLRDLAARMTQDLGERPGAGVRDLIAAVGEARRAMGLAELPGFAAVGGDEANVRGYPAAPVAGSNGSNDRPATMAPAKAAGLCRCASLTACGGRRATVENFPERKIRPWQGCARHLFSGGPFWHRLCYNESFERARVRPRFTHVWGEHRILTSRTTGLA